MHNPLPMYEIKYRENYILFRIDSIAEQICQDYHDQMDDDFYLVCLCVLKGAYKFFSELTRDLTEISIPLCLDFIQLSSYNGNTTSSKNVKLIKDLTIDKSLINRHNVLIIEDIIDTGYTLDWLVKHLTKNYSPKSIKIATLINKTSRRKVDINPDYFAIKESSDAFLVGFGLDDNEFSRELPHIYAKI